LSIAHMAHHMPHVQQTQNSVSRQIERTCACIV